MKLSQTMKDRMKNKILEAKFSKEEEANKLLFHELASDIYASYPDISKVSKIPNGWLRESTSIRANFGGCQKYIYLPEPKPMPYPLHDQRQDFASDHPFSIRFRALTDQEYDIHDRKKLLRDELSGVLNGVNTDKQLLTIWPEAIQWLPSTPIPLPVVTSVDRLKTMLGDL